jgi:hypothetical protein
MRTLLRPAAIVDAWFDMLPPAHAPTIRALRAAVMAAGPELQQVVKWGNLVFTWHGSHAFAIVAHKSHAHLQVFRGALVALEFPELEGSGKGPRHLKVRYGHPVDEEQVHEIVRAGIGVMHLPLSDDGGGDTRP